MNAASVYPSALSIHVVCVVMSGTLFAFRGILMLRRSPMLDANFLRIFPHVNDTVLLVAAIALSVAIGQYPFVHHWLTVKVAALLVYIVLGSVALREGAPRHIRVLCYGFALITFLFIVSVAWHHHPLGVVSRML